MNILFFVGAAREKMKNNNNRSRYYLVSCVCGGGGLAGCDPCFCPREKREKDPLQTELLELNE